jgi:hypothetical protein
MLSRLLGRSVQSVPGSLLISRAVSIMSRMSFFVVRPPSPAVSVNSAPSARMWSSFSAQPDQRGVADCIQDVYGSTPFGSTRAARRITP